MRSDLNAVRRMHAMPFGAEITERGVRFRLWAPAHPSVSLQLEGAADPIPMQSADGWHAAETELARAGTLYRFVLADGTAIPDPASRFQPFDVHGPSEVIDPRAYAWGDGGWNGRPWEEAVIYEMHVGTFTPAGTFRAAAEKLEALAALGVTAIELMPVADFPGSRSWGYDGVELFAPDSSYGRPEDLKALIDAAHHKGLMVFLDVVYNHFGPEGNYLAGCGPLFTARHRTPWGAGVNFDSEGSVAVRAFILANALYWIEEFHLDGLRFDAVHAIADDSPTHILDEIATEIRAAAAGRHVHLILENEDNSAARLARRADGQPIRYTAQWNDDMHHVLHTAVTGERAAYYEPYAGDTEKLGRALAEGFAFQGEMMAHRGRPRGEPSAGLPPTAFVTFTQNHDQIGNRAFGERLTQLGASGAVRAVTAIALLSPQIPMLFMGEEWGTRTPFLFFCDFGPELAQAVREGRRAELARFPEFADPALRDTIPDPTAEATFIASKLDWSEADEAPNAEWHAFYRRLLAVRRAEIVPRLRGIAGHSGHYDVLGAEAVSVAWRMGDGTRLTLLANLNEAACALPGDNGSEIAASRVIWREGGSDGGILAPWTVIFGIEAGGDRAG